MAPARVVAPRRRMSRAQWLTCGALCSSVVAVACTESSSPQVADVPDAASDASIWASPVVTASDAKADSTAERATCAPTTKTFDCAQSYPAEVGCGDGGVDRATCVTGKQVCSTFIGRNPWTGCNSGFHSAACVDVANDEGGAGAPELERLGFDAKCLATCASCACASQLKGYDGVATCQDLAGGGMIVHQVSTASGACYGCPPARILFG